MQQIRRSLRLARSRKAAVVALTLTVVGGVGGTAIALSANPHADPKVGPIAPQPSAVPADLVSAFPALGKPSNGNGLPPGLANQLSTPGTTAPGLGLNISLARPLETSQAASMWLVPGSGGICLVQGNPHPQTAPGFAGSAVCTTTAAALEEGIFMETIYSPSNIEVVGVAPVDTSDNAGAASVNRRRPTLRVRNANGRVRAVHAATDGSFHISTTTAANVTVDGIDGPRTLRIGR